jgi:hypothetical protein
MKSISRLLLSVQRRISTHFTNCAREKHPSNSVDGIEIIAPSHYVDAIQNTLNLFEKVDSEGYKGIKSHIKTIVAYHRPLTFGYVNETPFILDSFDEMTDDSIWIDLVGYLSYSAVLSASIKRGDLSCQWRRSPIQREANEVEQRVKKSFQDYLSHS